MADPNLVRNRQPLLRDGNVAAGVRHFFFFGERAPLNGRKMAQYRLDGAGADSLVCIFAACHVTGSRRSKRMTAAAWLVLTVPAFARHPGRAGWTGPT